MQALMQALSCYSTGSNEGQDAQQMPLWSWVAGGDAAHAEWLPDEVPQADEVVETSSSTFWGCCRLQPGTPQGGVYLIEVDRTSGADLGVCLDVTDEQRCVISHVKPGGLLSNWNKNAPKGASVAAGDCLLMVGDERGTSPKDLSFKLDSNSILTLTLQHPRVSNAKLIRRGRQLGIVVMPYQGESQNAMGFKISEVASDGVIPDWNAENKFKIQEGARIVAVNGERRHTAMLDSLKSSEMLDLKIIDWPRV